MREGDGSARVNITLRGASHPSAVVSITTSSLTATSEEREREREREREERERECVYTSPWFISADTLADVPLLYVVSHNLL